MKSALSNAYSRVLENMVGSTKEISVKVRGLIGLRC